MNVNEDQIKHRPLDPFNQIASFSLIPGKISITPAPNAKGRDWDSSLYAADTTQNRLNTKTYDTSLMNNTLIQTPLSTMHLQATRSRNTLMEYTPYRKSDISIKVIDQSLRSSPLSTITSSQSKVPMQIVVEKENEKKK